ncbi:GyrI-like domain-containing protein [Janthinobacterium fluminis]|uniref:GyrI-like domain-containing protein n=1 Tax=Janthinobacterium fluminis TaxID=2987524 RepID=A0ABT5K4U6_9BURK|nr:GyrI-like domain-containing protein [Janthinobacterium fluminis]MDC8759884.1 GyrI-like domain-containing protein [Janthinobacterium fluminis]
MQKIDFKKQLKHLYQPPVGQIVEVDVPELSYLMIDGAGDPNTSPGYAPAVEALYGLSYTLKFMLKKGPQAIDYAVMPLEGLWWADDMASFTTLDKSNWKWTLMIMQPPFISAALVEEASAALKKKKNPAALVEVRFAALNEGKVAQTMHIGPFSEEGPTIERLHQFIADGGRQRSGKHHEIYLSDIRRADPKNWKTVIRHPIAE